MVDKILLNNQEFHPGEEDLPCLIHYTEGTGGSHFSVTMLADLFLRRSKILFLTAYPMARENFLKQVMGHEDDVSFVTQKNQITTEKKALIIESGKESLFTEAMRELNDLDARIIFVKNFESFHDDTIMSVALHKKLIVSGNLDISSAKKTLHSSRFKTIIQFSHSDEITSPLCPNLEKHTGYFWQSTKDGLVKVITNQGN